MSNKYCSEGNGLKIVVNGKYRIARVTGVQRVAIEIVNSMREQIVGRKLDVDLSVIEPPTWMAKSRFRPVLALIWEQFFLPFLAGDALLLSLCNTGPVFRKNQALVLHDAAIFDMPENYGSRYVAIQQWLVRKSARRVEKVFTVSNFSRERLAYWLHINEADISILGVGTEHISRAAITPELSILNRLNLIKGGYLLAIGSRQPGKNFKSLLEAASIARLAVPVVIAGGVDVNVFGQQSLLENVHLIEAGYVSYGELVALLMNSCGYIQPSLYEGFGLPVIEAMVLGIPVICANAASLPEVCGDAAVYFNPRDPSDIAQALKKLLSSKELQVSLVEAGVNRAKQHSWDESAWRMLADLRAIKA